MWGRGLAHVCREGMGQLGTRVSLQHALECPEPCLATGVLSWHTPATWAHVSPHSVFWDPWSSDWAQWSPHGMYWHPCLGTWVSTRPCLAVPRAVAGHGGLLMACSRMPKAAARHGARSQDGVWLDPGVGQSGSPAHRPCMCQQLMRHPRRGARRGRGCCGAGEDLAAHGAPDSIQACIQLLQSPCLSEGISGSSGGAAPRGGVCSGRRCLWRVLVADAAALRAHPSHG